MIAILTFGIIGTGEISKKFIKVARECGCHITAVLSRDELRATMFSKENDISIACSDIDDFFMNDFDAVYIASPNYAHYGQIMKAIEYKKHILCEKPITSNIKELVHAVESARKSNCVLMEGIRNIFDPNIDVIKIHMQSIEPVRYVNLKMCQYSSRYDNFKNGIIENAFNPSLSNAAVMDIGVYPISLAVYLFGKPIEITSKSVFMSNGFEAMGESIFKYENMICSITYSKITDLSSQSEIQGENGSILIDKIEKPSQIILKKNNIHTLIDTIPSDNNMRYEIDMFKRLVSDNDVEHEFLKLSRTVMETIDIIRFQNKIIFSADK